MSFSILSQLYLFAHSKYRTLVFYIFSARSKYKLNSQKNSLQLYYFFKLLIRLCSSSCDGIFIVTCLYVQVEGGIHSIIILACSPQIRMISGKEMSPTKFMLSKAKKNKELLYIL